MPKSLYTQYSELNNMLEIERKFLVRRDFDIAALADSSTEIAQGYLSDDPDRTIRVRIRGDKAYMTVKSRNNGAVRNEWEYEIPVEDGRELIALPGVKSLVKTRYLVPYKGRTWEVDVFHGRHEGLLLAEVELESTDAIVELPDFVGKEVTDDARYYNSVLVKS